MSTIYFVSGIDTGVGKTVATALMARYWLKRGARVITVKLVQTGNVGHSEDLDFHRRVMGRTFPEDREFLTAPAIFSFPASPHLAAALDHRPMPLDAMRAAVRTLGERYEVVLVEGAGGLAVPLTDDLLTIDFAAAEQWTPLLVTSGKLGSLNHTILSLEALAARKLKLAGLVYNYAPDADPVIDADSPRTLRRLLQDRVPIVSVPKIPPEGPYPEVDFDAIFAPDRQEARP